MPKPSTWIPSLALAFAAVAGCQLGHDYTKPDASSVSTADLVQNVMPAVVRLEVDGPLPKRGATQSHGSGSGFIIDGKNGYIITNNHVIDHSSKIVVQLSNDKKYVGTLVGTDKLADIAVVKITPEAGTVLPQQTLADSDKLRLGDPVVAIGSPFIFRNSVSTGVISGLDRALGNGPVQRLIQNDAAINPGNSGGPLFNKDGKVIGVNNEIYTRTGSFGGISLAIPSNLAKMVSEHLIRDGKMSWGFMGVVMTMSTTGPKQSNVDPMEGLNIEVTDTLPSGPAEKAGLKKGDIIISINGKAVNDSSDVQHLVIPQMAGAKVDVGYLRGAETGHAAVTLGEMPVPSDTDEAENDNSPDDTPSIPSPGPNNDNKAQPKPRFHFGTPRP